MGRKGVIKHQKRLAAPKLLTIPRKKYKWLIKTNPGPHPADHSIPLMLILRDILGITQSKRESKFVLTQNEVKVDGKIRKSLKFPVGLMDVVEIPNIKSYYRVYPHPQKTLSLQKIAKADCKYKLCRIENKTTIKDGHIQLNLHDGRNIRIKIKDPQIREEDQFHTLDTLKLSIPKQKILDHIKFEEGIEALVIAGKNTGMTGKLKKVIRRYGAHANVATLESNDGTEFDTALEYVFPIKGVERPPEGKKPTEEPSEAPEPIPSKPQEPPGGEPPA